MELKVTKGGTEIGFIMEDLLQKVMKAQGFDHPLDAMQYTIEHLIAVSASIGIPSVAIIESCMIAIAAGSSAEARGMVEKLVEEFKSSDRKDH